MREVDIETVARALQRGATVVDVREPFEYRSGTIPAAKLIPMGSLAHRAGELPRGEPVYIVCAHGNRSLAVADALNHAGYEAYSVAGGMAAWARGGLPVAHAGDGTRSGVSR